MSEFERSKVSTVNEAILRRKFGDLYDWEKPLIKETVGPFNPSAFDGFSERLNLMLSEAHKALQSFNSADIAILHDRKLPDPEDKRTAWNDFLLEEVRGLLSKKPNWLIGGFGHPDYQADFEYWGQMEKYELHEALMLSVGIEPKHFGAQDLKNAEVKMQTTALIAPIEFVVRRHEQFLRKYPTGMYETVRVSPSFLYEWFTDIALTVHPRFLEALHNRVRGGKKNNSATVSIDVTNAKTDKREVDMIAQLFAAMAIDNYGYDPKAKRSPVPKEITVLAAEMGLSVTDDTVRKYLKLGSRFIPDDWKPS
jgi:hypothetical protein